MPEMPVTVDVDCIVDTLTGLVNTPSPTGMTEAAINYCEMVFGEFASAMHRTTKGGLVITFDGENDDAPRALTAHVDTLGAMVKAVKPNGRLAVTKLGGYVWQTVLNEGVTIHTADGKTYRGTLLHTRTSVHVYSDAMNTKIDDGDIEIRLDAVTSSADETLALGIDVGDVVSFDPRFETGEAGFFRARHLDDKAGVACIFGAMRCLREHGMKPKQRTTVLISNYEEVGHGAAAGFPDDVVELVAVDMAAIGDGQTSTEHQVTICHKDSAGPYSYALTNKLIGIARDFDVNFARDIYPRYGSDGEAYWRAGGDVQVALVGPGVDASHAYERTHRDALEATAKLIAAYLVS